VAPNPVFLGLGLTYSEDFGSAASANTLSSRTFVLHCNSLRILDLNLFFALHAICLHFHLLVCKILNRDYHIEHCQSIGFVNNSSFCILLEVPKAKSFPGASELMFAQLAVPVSLLRVALIIKWLFRGALPFEQQAALKVRDDFRVFRVAPKTLDFGKGSCWVSSDLPQKR
jgi:hypothetical protein